MSVKPPSPVMRSRATRYAVGAGLLAGLAACTSSGSAATGSSQPAVTTTLSAASPTATAAGRTITITVTGSAVTPKPAQVDLAAGATLTLVVTSDHDDELHAHGFEVEEALSAGRPTTLTLTGKDPGLFEVETHHPALTLLTVAVR